MSKCTIFAPHVGPGSLSATAVRYGCSCGRPCCCCCCSASTVRCTTIPTGHIPANTTAKDVRKQTRILASSPYFPPTATRQAYDGHAGEDGDAKKI